MQAVLKFVQTHLISLLSGAGLLIFLVLAILGMTSDSVEKRMQEVLTRTKAGSIRSLMANPVNRAVIDAEKARGEEFVQEFQKTQEVIEQINRRAPLMDGVFPRPQGPVVPLEYRDRYVQAVRELPRALAADTLPTEADIQEERQNVEDLLAHEKEKQEEEAGGDAAPQPPGGGGLPGRNLPPPPQEDVGSSDPGPILVGGGGRGSRGLPGRFAGAGLPRLTGPPLDAPKGEPKYDPVFRARVTKARNIRCYVDPQTFQVSPLAREMVAPKPDEMWFSQVALWIQQDVVNAIAELNGQAVEKLPPNEIALEHVPVKRLIAIRVFGYELPSGGRLPFRVASDIGPGPFRTQPGPSFTGRTSNEEFDVVRFAMQAIVDQRAMLQLIDAISRANFYQCVDLSYEEVDRQVEELQQGYFYGTAPVVRLTLDFEAYFSRQAYGKLMPPEVLAQLSAKPEGG